MRAFRRQLTYRAAAVSGVITNSFFGCIRAFVFIALYRARGGATVAGYNLADAITFVWLGQGLIAVVAIWGWWDVADTIRTGAVVTDLSRPYDYWSYWFARDAGRAAAQILMRGLTSFAVGAVLFGVSLPRSVGQWALFAVGLELAIIVSFGLCFIFNLLSFWLLDVRGIGGIWNALVILLSGFHLPLVYFPSGLRAICEALPFAAIIQTPADLFLGHLTGLAAVNALARQALWAVVLIVASRVLVRVATRKVVVQGG